MDDFLDFVKILAVPVVCLVLVGMLFYWFDAASCHAKTKNMGYESQYTMMGGCQIEVNPGQWIPLDSYYFKEE